MRCERCGGDFPKKQGRFCGTCPPEPELAEVCANVLLNLLCDNAHLLVGVNQDTVDRLQAAMPQRTIEGSGQGEGCPRKRSDMTPCVITDGEFARADDGRCVGCNLAIARDGCAAYLGKEGTE